MKTNPVGVELFHVDRQMDRRDEFNSRFPNFAKAPDNPQGIRRVQDFAYMQWLLE
jgi:hypothetical protein